MSSQSDPNRSEAFTHCTSNSSYTHLPSLGPCNVSSSLTSVLLPLLHHSIFKHFIHVSTPGHSSPPLVLSLLVFLLLLCFPLSVPADQPPDRLVLRKPRLWAVKVGQISSLLGNVCIPSFVSPPSSLLLPAAPRLRGSDSYFSTYYITSVTM